MAVFALESLVPDLHPSTFVAETATVVGAVVLGRNCSVWPQAVLRADNEPIEVGEGSNVQEGAVLHNDPGYPVRIGSGVTIGHQAMLHGCTIGDNTLVGVQAVVLNGAVIGRNCLVAAGSVIPEGKVFAEGSLIIGAPARAVRLLSQEEVDNHAAAAREYVARAQRYKETLQRVQ
jgi:carbonic anhydrase/acetyltransferase-like protein (isoleucine patch superfamily)